ncbi:nickel ABC transporter permease subunit NikC [Helicobacter saguini]|uniref:nickel ABC transporter permease subunit NikC n=1 Tax=Helicobacter saguini TaxID=1548018 RepID=UPI000513B5B0|nr:nickel ABC transporter permease subunit NikC [Helicobacter saguini]
MSSKSLKLSAKIALVFIVILAICAIFAPFILSYNPNEINLDSKLLPPSMTHILGTDYLGRDIFTRLIYGARISLSASFATLALILFFGIALGGVSGFVGGALDRILMRLCDVFLSFPTIILSLFLVAILGGGLANVIVAIAATHFAWYARIVRAIIFSAKNKEYVALSAVYGLNAAQSFKRNMLPPILRQCATLAMLDIGHIMLHISGLSFVGLGVAAPTAEWGIMIADSKDYIWSNPSLILYPGAALFICVVAFNVLGDGVREYFSVGLKN